MSANPWVIVAWEGLYFYFSDTTHIDLEPKIDAESRGWVYGVSH